MQIHFLGAARTVTGSQYFIEVNGKQLLLDCGLYQGKRKEAFELNRQGVCDRDPAQIDCLVLSHAHIDHSGNIPCLVKRGFNGDIFCTSATRDLCAAMLMDSAHIQEQDVAYVNKLRRRKGQNPFDPLYTKEDVVRAMDLFVGLSYNRSREILPGVRLTLIDAGHLMGSASIILDIEDREDGKSKRLLFSGDIGRPDIPIIRDPVLPEEGADILLIESTYGNRLHPPYPQSERALERIVNDTYRQGGSLLIPAFAVGRTQQIVYALHQLHESRDIPDVPIFVDSPLATRVTDIFRLHPETYDAELRDFMLQGNHSNPFGFETLRFTQTVGDSKELNFLREPAIIISASGMLEGGRILHHLSHRIGDPRTTILLTGWQAPNTLGRRLQDGEKLVRIFGEEFKVAAKVEMMPGFSGHADREGLMAWAGSMKRKPTRTFVVHGEEESALALAAGLSEELGFANVEVPTQYQSVTV